jgi:hypothetical protein
MSHLIIPKYVFDDIDRFIHENYHYSLPHSLLISQAFCLRFKDYGNEFGVSEITDAVEYVRNHQQETRADNLNKKGLILEDLEGLY